LTWFAAQFTAFYLAAFGAERRRLRIFGNVATAWRTLNKTTFGTRSLVWLTAKLATFYLAAHRTKRNTVLGFCCVGLLAAIGAKKYSDASQ
jgi:hypothetical protein